jgi:hypothetical protein
MSAYDDLIELLADYPNSISHEGAEEAVGAHRAEVLAKAIGRLRAVPVQCTALTGPVWYGQGWADAISTLEDIADYSVPDYEEYPGELVRLRALALQLRALARRSNWDRVMQVLHGHSAAESTARAEVAKKASATAAPTATAQVEFLQDFLTRLESSAGYGVVENFLAHNPDLEQLTEVSTPK